MRTFIALAFMVASSEAAPPSIDWASGLVSAEGIGLADRHAPNPAVARGTSRRDGEAAARKELAKLVATIPVAGGGTVGEAAKKDKAVAERIERAVSHALTVAADPETDGAWRVTLAVPLEAVRQALSGPRVLAAGGHDAGPSIVIVEGVSGKPAVGVTFGGVEAAAVWVDGTRLPAWAKAAPRAKGSALKKGAIEVSGITPTAATLFVVITGS
jgi:hypothetical protein